MAAAKLKKIPQLLFSDYGQGDYDFDDANFTLISNLPTTFIFREWAFMLRFVILHGSGHFTSVMRFPACWMLHDDMMGQSYSVKMKSFPLTEAGAVKAMGGRGITGIFYGRLLDTQCKFSNICCKMCAVRCRTVHSLHSAVQYLQYIPSNNVPYRTVLQTDMDGSLLIRRTYFVTMEFLPALFRLR